MEGCARQRGKVRHPMRPAQYNMHARLCAAARAGMYGHAPRAGTGMCVHARAAEGTTSMRWWHVREAPSPTLACAGMCVAPPRSCAVMCGHVSGHVRPLSPTVACSCGVCGHVRAHAACWQGHVRPSAPTVAQLWHARSCAVMCGHVRARVWTHAECCHNHARNTRPRRENAGARGRGPGSRLDPPIPHMPRTCPAHARTASAHPGATQGTPRPLQQRLTPATLT